MSYHQDIKLATSIGDLHQDQLDSRDLVKLLDRLEWGDEPESLSSEETELLSVLKRLRDECEGSGWKDGIQFISDYYWKEYCQEWANDVGYCGDGFSKGNPLMDYVDWERWANEMKNDFIETTIGHRVYYWREA